MHDDAADVRTRLAEADRLMAEGAHKHANEVYAAAWNRVSKDKALIEAFGRRGAFWILMSGLESLFVSGRHDTVMTVCQMAAHVFAKDDVVVGNPYFHLRAGQSRHVLSGQETPKAGLNDLVHALECGGSEIFAGEDPKFLHMAASRVMPPEGVRNWEQPGLGRRVFALNGATGHLATVFAQKYGAPPPYPEPQ